MPKPPLALLVSLVVLALAGRPSTAQTGPCLSGHVGEILSAKLAAHAFDGALPAGWTLREVHVGSDRIDLGVGDAQGRPRDLALRLGDEVRDVDGRGRWFAFVIDPREDPLDAEARQGMLDLAARVDAVVPAEEALRVCEGQSGTASAGAVDSSSARHVEEPPWVRIGAAFYAMAIVGAAVAVLRCRRSVVSRQAIAPAVLTAIALGVRLLAHPMVGDIRQVLGGAGLYFEQRRAGWSALLRLLFALLPPRYETIWAVHRVVGALAVPLLYVALRQRFRLRSVAAAGAAALAIVPLAARFSASDTPYVPLCTALLGAVVALTRFRRSGSRGALGLGLVLLTAAMQLRPDGPWIVVPVLLLVLTVPAVARGRALSVTTLVAASLFLAANVTPSLWAIAGHAPKGGPGSVAFIRGQFVLLGTLVGSPWSDLDMSPWPLSLLVVGGLVLAPLNGRRGVGWAAATLVAMPLSWPATAQYANARYHLPAVYLACGLAGVAAAFVVERVRRRLSSRFPATVAAAALALVAAVPRLDLLKRTWTPQEEFEFYRAGLQQIGPDCTVVALMAGNDAGFVPFSDPGVAAPTDIGPFLATPTPSARECLVYYRAGNCLSADVLGLPNGVSFGENPACWELERRATLLPIAEARLPARPYRGERYSTDPVPIGFYRIVSVAPGASRSLRPR